MEPSFKKLKTSKEEETSEMVKKELEEKRKEAEELNQFVKLFDEVLKENKEDISDEDIEEGVIAAIEFFKKGISNTCDKEKLNSPNILCGFFHRYSPLYAGKTRRLILDALHDCQELRSLFHRPSLKIVDVGSGACSGMIGFYSALYEEEFPFDSLEVTAIDYNDKWEPFFKDIEKKLREENFGNASKLFNEKDIKCNFVCFNLLKNNTYKEEKCLKEADIIFIKGFISVLKNNDMRYRVMKNVASVMKPGSFLLNIESKTYKQYFIRENLSLVYYTKKYDPTTSTSTNVLSANYKPLSDSDETPQGSSYSTENSTSQTSPNVFQQHGSIFKLKYEEDNKFNFSVDGVKKYGPGICKNSNQQIYIFIKQEKRKTKFN